MNDYLSTLAFRAVRPAETLQPRRPGMFEPAAGGLGADPIPRSYGGEDREAEQMTPSGDGDAPSPAASRAMSPGWRLDRIVAPAAASRDPGRNEPHAGDTPPEKLSGEMAAEDLPDRKGSRSTAGFLRSHDISAERDAAAGAVHHAAEASRDPAAVPAGNRGNVPGNIHPLAEPGSAAGREERSLLQPPPRRKRTLADMSESSERDEPDVPLLRGAPLEPVGAPDGMGRDRIGTLRGGEEFSGGMEEPFRRNSGVLPGIAERRLMPHSVPEAAAPERSEPPVVRVTIGRIEVRAVMPQPQRPEPPARKREPRLSLDQYLRSQKGERR